MIELTTDNLGEVIENNDKVVIQYGAAWCGACRLIKPKVKRLSKSNEDVTFVYVDAEVFPNSRSFAEVTNLPTFVGYSNGKLIKQGQGTKIEVVEDILNEVTSN
jgi:thiol-disulfide isomerase/thioredoxin